MADHYITHEQYKILVDHMDIYQFMLEIYTRDWRNGVPAPFLEYALSSSWMDRSYTHRNRIWRDPLDNNRIVAFCFYENPVTDIYFCLRPEYETLAYNLVKYADQSMPGADGEKQFVIFENQTALIQAAAKLGYKKTGEYVNMQYDFEKPLEYTLPEGFRFVPPKKLEKKKIAECCWKGFDHEVTEGLWNGDAENVYHLYQAPHATTQYAVAIENEAGDYVCFAGMWWTPENHLAYMEPLCTIPEYRHKGLASAALSELYRRMKPLGATHMTGGGNPFYEKIGYQSAVTWTFWKKQ